MKLVARIVKCLLLFSFCAGIPGDSWSDWWSYDGFSGPDYWGLVNPEWSLCAKGKRQSPINVDPAMLLYDPFLKPIKLDPPRVAGVLTNTGQDVSMIIDLKSPKNFVNLTGGPLAYKYRFAEMKIHFGSAKNAHGSEHMIGGKAFPAEVQLIAFNSDLYSNYSTALMSYSGISIVSILVHITAEPNAEFDHIAKHFNSIRFKGQTQRVEFVSPHALMPDTDNYITYEGSITWPGCYETVTWIIMNRPIYVSEYQLASLYQMMQGDRGSPRVPIENNARPTMLLNGRPLRTNINFPRNSDKGCPSMQLKEIYYRANSWYHS